MIDKWGGWEAPLRVLAFIDQFDRLTDTGGTILTVHTDPNKEPATLTSADLREILEDLQ